jgi:hypothetical protein
MIDVSASSVAVTSNDSRQTQGVRKAEVILPYVAHSISPY